MTDRIESKVEKIAALKQNLKPMIGKKLLRFETAQLKMDDGSWDDWFDLPIRLFFGSENPNSLAWSHFDKLFVSNDFSLPFDPTNVEVVWRTNRIKSFIPLVSESLKSVRLGEGTIEFGTEKNAIWTRLLLDFDVGCMEIYNGLDTNAFAFHSSLPSGNFELVC